MSEPRRIVIASTDFRPMVGGIADHLHGMAEALAACADVTVATSVPQRGLTWSHSYRLTTLPPLPERRLGRRFGDELLPVRKLHTLMYFLSLKRYARSTVRRLASDLPGCVVIIGLWDTASHFWCRACQEAGIAYYIVAHGLEMILPLYGSLPEWRRRDFAGAAGIFANSRATAALAVSALGVAETPAVVNPIAAAPFTGPAVDVCASELRRLLGDPAGPVLLSVGRLVPRKGFDAVLRSVAALARDFPNVRYVLIGDGPERQRLQDEAAALGILERVLMLGRADDAMKWAAYDRCDLFVMPNRALNGTDWEGFGIVFVEAARAGRAVVAGKSGGVADAVVDGRTGLLVDPDDEDALRHAVHRLLGDDVERAHMAQAAARFASQHFTTDALRGALMNALGWS
jgi:phosphatidylinositol alpha-1,6-mannosyltransferase